MSFKIALAGDLGGGKTTVANLLHEMTGAETYSTGVVCRAMAAKKGMQIADFNQYMETHPEVDQEIDDGLIALSDRPEDWIIDSRMAFHFVRDSFAVYLTTDPLVTAERVFKAKRTGESATDLNDALRVLKLRRESEAKRYSGQYGVNIKDLTLYDFVIDTSYIDAEQVAKEILRALEAWQEDPSRRAALLSPKRIYTRDGLLRPADPCPNVVEQGNNFYLLTGSDTLEATKDCPLVPCDLVSSPKPEGDYRPLVDQESIR